MGRRSKFLSLGLALIVIALPLTIILTKHQQDLTSRAAAPDQLEAEGGVLSSNVSIKNDTLASNGQYVQFNLPSVTPTPTVSKPDAGLNAPFQNPSPVTGAIINITSFGATSNNSTDDDSVAIKNAITSAKAGDEVYIPNGNYHIKTAPIYLKTGVSVIGQSETGTILTGVFSASPSAIFHAQSYLTSDTTHMATNNLNISNFSFTSTNKPPDYVIRLGNGNYQTNNNEYQIATRIKVDSLSIEKYTQYGIAVQNGQNILISNNTLKNATALGGNGQGYGISLNFDHSTNNWVIGNSAGPVIRHAFLLAYRANHNLFENNTADGTVNDAFDLHGEDEYSNEFKLNKVVKCSTADPYTPALKVYPSAFGVGEVPTNTSGTGAAAHDITGPNNWIHDNDFGNCYAGVRINSTNYTYVDHNTIHNNINGGVMVGDLISCTQDPSYTTTDSACTPQLPRNKHNTADHSFVRDNTITGNSIGISLNDADFTTVNGNSSTNNTSTGLKTTTLTNNYTITNNNFLNNPSKPSLGSTNGTYLNNQE